MKVFLICILIAVLATTTTATSYNVSTAKQLRKAFLTVEPGDNIYLNGGVYNGSVGGLFNIYRSGNATHPITMNSSGNAILTSAENGYALYMNASYWIIKRLEFAFSKKGIFTETSKYNVFDKVNVHHIGEEGVHFKLNSTDNILKNSRVRYTGRTNPGIGEGIYIGTATARLNGIIDHSDRNRIINNTIGPFVSADHIDVKEDTRSGFIYNNTFDATGQTGIHDSDTVVNLKGNDYIISDNTIINGFKDGIKLNPLVGNDPNSGCDNYILNNICLNKKTDYGTVAYSNSTDTIGVCVRATRRCFNFVDRTSVTIVI